MCTQTAKSMVFEGVNQPFVPREFPLPTLEEGEVLVKITYSTLCTSDLHTYFGKRSGPTHSILGHEIIGYVAALPVHGAHDLEGNPLREGDRVTWSVYAYDPASEMAKRGMPQKTKGLYKYGHEAITDTHQLNGGFATHCHLKKGTAIFKVPDDLTLQEAAPLNCTHATMAGALRLAGALEGKNVLVSGVGMLGVSACAQAKESGAHQVFALDVSTEKRTHAARFGADMPLDAQAGAGEIGKKLLEKGGVDVVFETSGVPEAVEKAIGLLDTGGTAVLVGSVYPQREISLDAERLVRRLLTIKGLHNYAPQDLAAAVRFLGKAKYRYPFHQLVGAEFGLDQLDAAFEEGKAGKHYRVGVQTNTDE